MVDILDPVAQNVMDRSSPKISGLVDGCKGLYTTLSFFDFSRDVARQPIKVEKLAFSPDQSTL